VGAQAQVGDGHVAVVGNGGGCGALVLRNRCCSGAAPANADNCIRLDADNMGNRLRNMANLEKNGDDGKNAW